MKKPPKWGGGGRRAQSITPSQPNKNLDVPKPLTCPQQKNLFYLAQQTSDRVSQTSALL